MKLFASVLAVCLSSVTVFAAKMPQFSAANQTAPKLVPASEPARRRVVSGDRPRKAGERTRPAGA